MPNVPQIQEQLTDSVLLAVVMEGERSQTEDNPLGDRQRQDPELSIIFNYLEKRDLPKDDKVARELMLAESRYAVIEGVLYRVEEDKSLRIIPPAEDCPRIFGLAHGVQFSGHSRETKIHRQFSR